MRTDFHLESKLFSFFHFQIPHILNVGVITDTYVLFKGKQVSFSQFSDGLQPAYTAKTPKYCDQLYMHAGFLVF